MIWRKLGHVFTAKGEFDWMQTHASNPFAWPVSDTVLRVYFTVRDSKSRSYITFGDFDTSNNFKLIYLSPHPVLEPGELGLFDDSGVAVGFLIEINGVLNLYYLGWNLKVTVPWLNTIGRAIWSKEEKRFIKNGRVPVMDRSEEDPYSISYPSIMQENGLYRMWYGSNLKWGATQDSMQHVFKYAESVDGQHWKRTNQIVVNLQHPGEYALSKPFVIKVDGTYKMWYSYRANGTIQTYRIGYAESNDGLNWVRKDHLAGIDVSDEGWDSQMISYPCVFKHKDTWYMLYNGNEYGKAGFGLAVASNAK